MRLQDCRLWFLISVVFLLQAPNAYGLGPVRRQDDSPSRPTPSPSPSPSPSSSPSTTRQTRSAVDQASASRARNADDTPSTVEVTQSSTEVASSTPTSTGIPLHETIPDGQLPLQPLVTPGWGVAGVLLLCSGAVHALIGIKNSRVYTFFSTAYLTGLGTAVLIIYIMTPPIALSIQGGYVVAVVLTGAALGAIATFFKEITEGFSCMLGGFCVAMWLLCLRSGGLLAPDSLGKVLLIVCFTAATFLLYFSRWTRAYALIFSISFSGATATVLGIDCFSRAGLKEFWAYLWDLNENLFPLRTHTYPLTRGIEVELAAIVILCLAGIVSQLRLWRVIQERRAKKDAERAEGQRALDQEEEAVGRNIETENARERKIWERAYGNGDSQSTAPSNDSGYAPNVDSEKGPDGPGHSKNSIHDSAVQVHIVEMDQTSTHDQPPAVPPKAYQPASVMSRAEHGGSVTVRVANDDTHPAPPVGTVEAYEEMDSKAMSGPVQVGLADPTLVVAGPVVVPLPFAVPSHCDDEIRDMDERSSVATFADEDVNEAATGPRKQPPLARRLSQVSMDNAEMTQSQREARTAPSDINPSDQDFIVPKTRHDPDNGSIAATMDLDSLDGDSRSIGGASRHSAVPAAGETRNDSAGVAAATSNTKEVLAPKSTMPNTPDAPEVAAEDSRQEHVEGGNVSSDVQPHASSESSASARQPKAQSSVSAVESVPTSLTEGRLPHALSRVAMSYRTNEWAKHLGHADMPAPDTLHISNYSEEATAEEASAPVDLQDLQQTAETGTPAPHMPRSSSAMGHSLARTDSQLSMAPPLGRRADGIAGLPSQALTGSQAGMISRQASVAGMGRVSRNQDSRNMAAGETITRADSRSSSSATSSVAGGYVTERPPVPGVVSYSSPQTLIGQRDLYLRNKTNPTLPASMTTPDLYAMQGMAAETGSIRSYAAYASPPMPFGGAADDLPLSQRREMMRRNSALRSSVSFTERPVSTLMYPGAMSASSEALAFDSHQPQRHSTVPSQAARDSQLAAFRQSVQMDMRSGTPVLNNGPRARESFYGTTFGSSTGLDRELEVQRSIDAQRAMMLEQKGAEAQRREMERSDRERADHAFMTMMQSGQWNDAHRDMLRKMQSSANIRD